jgi:hypothetical protein
MYYSFDFDEAGLSSPGLLEGVLTKIWMTLSQRLNVQRTKSGHVPDASIDDMISVVGGVTEEEAIRIKMAFTLLNFSFKKIGTLGNSITVSDQGSRKARKLTGSQ